MTTPSEDLDGVPKMTAQENIPPEKSHQPGESPLLETTAQQLPKLPKKINEGDWVKILDKAVAKFFFESRAKVTMLIKSEVDSEGKPLIKPQNGASPREKADYDSRRLKGVKEEVRARLYGLTADQAQKKEYDKSILVGKLKKIETPPGEQSIKKPEPRQQGGQVSYGPDRRSKFHNPTEIKIERVENGPRKKRRRGER